MLRPLAFRVFGDVHDLEVRQHLELHTVPDEGVVGQPLLGVGGVGDIAFGIGSQIKNPQRINSLGVVYN